MLPSVLRASKRSATVVHEEMQEGLGSLATIASIAPWVGIFGTLWGIIGSFRGGGGEATGALAALNESLSESLWPTAIGLLAGLGSLLIYRYLADRLRTFDQEMENASLGLVDQLRRQRGPFVFEAATEPLGDRPMFGEKTLSELRRDQKFLQRSIILAGVGLLVAWCAQAVVSFYDDFLPLASIARGASVHIVLLFSFSFLPTYPIWVKLMHRRRGARVALASAFCLCWSVAELLVGGHLP
jgi:hypothetical protein